MNMHVMLIKHVHMEQATGKGRGISARGRKPPSPYRPTDPSGNGVRWKPSLDQDPSTQTAQDGPGWGEQMHAMRPLIRTKQETFKSQPEGGGWIPKPEEGGEG